MMFLRPGVFGSAAARGGGVVYSTEAQQFFDRVSDPGGTRKGLYATLIDALVAGSVWTKLDAFYVLAAAASATALTNLVSSSYGATVVNAPLFTTDRGYTANATGTKYVETGMNPTVGTPHFIQDSAHHGVWVLTARAGNGHATGQPSGPCHTYPRFNDDNTYLRVNDSAAGKTVTTSNGFYLGNRSGANAREGYKDGVSLGAYGVVASTSPANEAFRIGYGVGGGSDDQYAAMSVGSSLTAGQQLAFYNALLAYLQAVGASA